MRAPLNRSARRVIAGTICGMLPLIAGCDSPAHQADRKARAETETAETLLITGEDPSRALELLTSAAGNTEAAPATRLRANALLGQVLMEDARKIAWSVDRLMRDSQRLSMEIAQLCGQTQFAAQLARGYQKLDPTPIVNNLSKQAEDARGGADRLIWFEANGMRFETVAAAAQEISRLEGEIARLQEQIRSLEAQRDAALTSAEKAALEAESARGREAVEAFIRASNARKQAADLAVQIDLQQAALRPLQKNLAIVVARKEYISAAAKALEDQGSAMQNSWLTIQKAAAAQQALIRTITTGTEPGEAVTLSLPEGVQVSIDSLPAGSIAQKASKLAEIDRLAEAQRAVALEKLNSAVKHLADAVIAADIARKDVELAKAEHPGAAAGQVKAWESSRNTLSAATYRVQQAAALQLLAELHASHAAALDLRRKLQALVAAALAGTGVEPPSVLADPQPVQDQWQQAADAADEAYRSADELLETVLEAGQTTEAERAAADAARISRIFQLYSWSILSAERGATEQARTQMDLAKSMVTDAVTNGIRLPALPPVLAAAAAAVPRPVPQEPSVEPTPSEPGQTTPQEPSNDQNLPVETPPANPDDASAPPPEPPGGGPG